MPASPADQTRCGLCGDIGRRWLVARGRELRKCRACGFAWIVQGLERDADGRSLYEGDQPIVLDPAQADYYRDETAEDAVRDKVAWVARYLTDGSRLLDIGANLGLFVRAASPRFSATGIEPSPAVVAAARREYGAELHVGSIYDEPARFEGQFDGVMLFDVLEHLSEPDRALQRCRAYLRPGGHLFVTTPDAGSAVARLLGRHWHYIDMREHVALFTRSNLTTLLTRNGFRRLEVRTIARPYRFSYIRRRLAVLADDAPLLRVAHAASWPLALRPSARVRLNLGDVMGVVAVSTD